MTPREHLRALLPSIPSEAFDVWLGPHVDANEWQDSFAQIATPPSPWKAYLLGESLDFWMRVNWQLVELGLSELPLDGVAKKKLEELIEAWDCWTITGKWPGHLLQNSPERIGNVLRYISVNASLPNPIVCLNRGSEWQLADGYHRLAAAYMTSPDLLKPVRVWLAQSEI